jgi:hypothetical protein
LVPNFFGAVASAEGQPMPPGKLYRQTKDAQYLALAGEIADGELARLDQVEYPQWWRMPERTALLDGLLALHETIPTIPDTGVR